MLKGVQKVMAKVKNWLFAMDAKGHLGHQLTGQGSLGGQRVQPYRKPGGKPSERQEAQRSKWRYVMGLWRKNYEGVDFYWDGWNKSRRILGEKNTSLGLFQKQANWAIECLNNGWECKQTKICLRSETEDYYIKAEATDRAYMIPMSAWIELASVEESSYFLLVTVAGEEIDTGEWTYIEDFYEVPLTFKWNYTKIFLGFGVRRNIEIEKMILPIIQITDVRTDF